MLRTFNCGIGMIVVMGAQHVNRNLAVIERAGLEAHVIGRIVPRGQGPAVVYRGTLQL